MAPLLQEACPEIEEIEPAITPDETQPVEEVPTEEVLKTVRLSPEQTNSPEAPALSFRKTISSTIALHNPLSLLPPEGNQPSAMASKSTAEAPVTPPEKNLVPKKSHGCSQGVRLRSKIDPAFPRRRLQAGEMAIVWLLVTVDGKGKVEGIEVLSDGIHQDFLRSAIAAIQEARFEPAMENGQPIPGRIKIKVDFRIL
jgi:protein TonB